MDELMTVHFNGVHNTFFMIIRCNHSHAHVLGNWISDHDGITSCHSVDSITFACRHLHQQFAHLKNRNKIHNMYNIHKIYNNLNLIDDITRTRGKARLLKLTLEQI